MAKTNNNKPDKGQGKSTGAVRGADKAAIEGHASYRARVAKLAQAVGKPWGGRVCKEPKVDAVLNFGRWMAVCECGGCEYVDPDDAIFYCCSCGNERTKGQARPVAFPAQVEAIERAVMKRPVVERGGKNASERAMYAKPVKPGLSRSWSPGETLEDILEQNRKGGIE